MDEEQRKNDKDTGVKALFLDLTGYDRGLLITLIDLYKNPLNVVESNKRGDKKYISGNRLLLSSLGIWVLFNSLIIDWDSAVSRWLYARSSLLGGFVPDENIVSKISAVAADVMERYIAPITIVYVVLATWIARSLSRHLQVSAREHLEVMTYSTALYYLVMTVFSIVFAINGLVAEVLLITVGIISWTGYKNYLELVRTRNFFEHDGKELESNYRIAKGLSSVILTVVSLAAIISYHVLG